MMLGVRDWGSADQKPGDIFDRLLRGREADALQAAAGQVFQALQRQREVAAALVARQGVNLVYDHGPDAAQHLAGALRREDEVERLGRGHEDMRRSPHHLLTRPSRSTSSS